MHPAEPLAPLLLFHPSILLRISRFFDEPVTFSLVFSTYNNERRVKMKNIGKIIMATLLAMSLMAWASLSVAGNGHYRPGQMNHYKNDHTNYSFGGYLHNYTRHRYHHYGNHYQTQPFPPGHYSDLGFYLSPRGTRIQIRLGF